MSAHAFTHRHRVLVGRALVVSVLFAAACAHTPPAPPAAAANSAAPSSDWVARSNANTKLLIDVTAEFEPEYAARVGVTGVDDHVHDFSATAAGAPARGARRRARGARQAPSGRARSAGGAGSRHPHRRRQARNQGVGARGAPPRALLEPAAQHLRLDALAARFRRSRPSGGRRRWCASAKYAGLEPGQPRRWRSSRRKSTTAWCAVSCRRRASRSSDDLETAPALIDGIEKLFKQFPGRRRGRGAAELARAARRRYHEFVQASTVLPRARDDFRLPPELYAFNLEQFGVDIPPAELARRAHEALRRDPGRDAAAGAAGREGARLAVDATTATSSAS